MAVLERTAEIEERLRTAGWMTWPSPKGLGPSTIVAARPAQDGRPVLRLVEVQTHPDGPYERLDLSQRQRLARLGERLGADVVIAWAPSGRAVEFIDWKRWPLP